MLAFWQFADICAYTEASFNFELSVRRSPIPYKLDYGSDNMIWISWCGTSLHLKDTMKWLLCHLFSSGWVELYLVCSADERAYFILFSSLEAPGCYAAMTAFYFAYCQVVNGLMLILDKRPAIHCKISTTRATEEMKAVSLFLQWKSSNYTNGEPFSHTTG